MHVSLRSFSWKQRITDLRLAARHHVSVITGKRIFLSATPTRLYQDNQTPGSATFLRHSFSQTTHTKYRNINLLSIAYSFRSQLRADLPWADSPGPGTLRFSAGGILTLLIATHLSISSCGTSSVLYQYTFVGTHNALLPLYLRRIHIFGN